MNYSPVFCIIFRQKKISTERKTEMKKIRNIVTMVCALAAAAALWMQAGSAFMKLQAGAEPLDSETEFGQVRGEYISYEAAYPVGVCVEEYYSGDPDRVRTYGYVVYVWKGRLSFTSWCRSSMTGAIQACCIICSWQWSCGREKI